MPPRRRPRKRNTRMGVAIDAMRPFGFSEALVQKAVKELLQVYGGDDYWPFIEECNYKELLEKLLESNVENGEDNDKEEEGMQSENNSMQEQEAPALSICSTSNAVGDSDPIRPDTLPAIPEPVRTEEIENVAPPEICYPVENMDCDAPVEGNGNGWKDIRLDKSSNANNTGIAVSNRDEFAQTNGVSGHISSTPSSSNVAVSTVGSCVTCTHPVKHHAINGPCYGWIDSDEGEPEFIHLKPAPRQTPPSTPMLSEHSHVRRTRGKSRWDERPVDG